MIGKSLSCSSVKNFKELTDGIFGCERDKKISWFSDKIHI